ncbi:aminoglycoside phosphotransferase family protein [Fictibacillus barbaricus]|uniref:Fructosamine-3-kinase n=1 Tax=Fictibacillus barbaricus TaxID=182136 RepID=A0ABU1TWJ1_9BACL|nr:aminoglycoside phosphotransferase family protein [Fictibacillus barbaricus]MDR7071579.1 fructosamine-3-kinase [Fictibacillus barbaricus]
MNIQEIIKDLTDKKMLQPNIQYEQLNGGTTSKLYLCKDETTKFVIKMNEPHVLEAESHFLNFYKKVSLLPRLVYVDPSFHYIVYSFIPGSVHYNRSKKNELLFDLVHDQINHYQPVSDSEGWGWADETVDSWQAFLEHRFMEASKTLESHLQKEDLDIVAKLVKSPNRKSTNKEPYLLHGDCGVHNFIFDDRKLCGVIDPTPVYGEPLYDLIYAFCSSPDDLTKETINTAVSHLKNNSRDDKFLYEEVLIGLFLRIATCVRHHPDDLEEYLRAWSYWKDTVLKGE